MSNETLYDHIAKNDFERLQDYINRGRIETSDFKYGVEQLYHSLGILLQTMESK